MNTNKVFDLSLETWGIKCSVFDLQRQATISVNACEAEADDTQDYILKCEEAYELNPNDNTGIELERAYNLHDRAMRELYEAKERLDYISKALEMLDRAEQYLAWAE